MPVKIPSFAPTKMANVLQADTTRTGRKEDEKPNALFPTGMETDTASMENKLTETIYVQVFYKRQAPSWRHTLEKLPHKWMRRFATALFVAAGNRRHSGCSPSETSG